MYITSPTFIEKATAHARRSLVRVVSSDTLAELEVLQLDFDDTREGFIGGFSARKLELLLDNFDPSLHTNVKAYMGFQGAVEEVLLGEFKIDTEDITYDDLKDTHKIVCYDRALDFDVQYEPVTLPATGAQIIAEIASRFGIEVVPYNLPMRDFTINELNINEDDIISYRQVISKYAQANLATAHITADGKLQFKTVFGKIPVATIDGVDYTDLVLDKAVKPINALVYNQSEVEDPVFVRNDSSIALYGLTEIKLIDNLWIDPMTRVEKEVYLDSVYNLLFEASTTADYEYHPFETSLFVRPDLEAMDTIIIKDKNDTTYTTVLQNMSFTWNGGLKGKMECEPLPETLTDYTLSKEEYERLVMGIKVDRVNGIITSTVQRVNDVESKASVLEQTADGIRQAVANIKIGGRNLLLKSNETVTLSAEQKTYEITKLLPETEYTVSINGTCNEPIEVWLTTLTVGENGIIETEVNQNNAVYVGDLEDNKLTFTAQELHTALVIRTLGDLELTTIQLEKGTLVTDWTPAPEEQERRLSSVEQTAEGTQTTLTNLKEDVTSRMQFTQENVDGVLLGTLSIGDEKSKFKVAIQGTNITFYGDGSPMATMTNNSILTEKMVVDDTLDISNFGFWKEGNGSITFGKKV